MIHHSTRPKNHFKLAIGLILLADLFCAGQAIFVKMASPYLGANALTFVRCFVNLIILYGWTLFTEGSTGFKTLYSTKALKRHMVRSLSGAGAVYCLYYGLVLMPIGPATLLFFTFPVFIPVIARIWLKVALIHRLWWGIGVSFLGILLILHPGAGLFDIAALIPLFGAILGSIATLSVRVLHHTEKSKTIMAYYFTAGTIISALVLAIFYKQTKTIFTFYSLSMAVLVGIAAAIFQTLFTLSTKHAPTRFLSPFIYGIFIFAALGDYFIWGKLLDFGTLIGFLLICVGAILMAFLYPKNDLVFVSKKKD